MTAEEQQREETPRHRREQREEGDGSSNEDIQDAAREEEEEEAPSHLPFAPATELLDVATTVDPSYIISLIRKILPRDRKTEGLPSSKINGGECTGVGEREKSALSGDDFEKDTSLAVGGVWEECGCILWDLSVDIDHAKFMVENLLLEVLVANLSVSNSGRVTEICLGIIGNLACHDVLSNAIISTEGLVETVVHQLFHEDSVCLFETCRLFTSGLQGGAFATWAEALQQEYVLQHILWIAENTLNLQLLDKTIGLLLTIAESQEVSPILIPSLKALGLPHLLVTLLACEMDKVINENKLERISVLELILQSIEALSTIDSCSKVVSSDKELFRVLCDIIKLSDKIEVANCYATVSILVANILTDEPHLASDISQDISFIQGLFDIFPFVSTDSQARNALWSIIARLLSHVHVNAISPLALQQYVSLLLEKAHLVEEDLDEHSIQESQEGFESNSLKCKNLDIAIPSLRPIASLLDKWMSERTASEEDLQLHDGDEDRKAKRLLEYCVKYAA